MPWRLNARYSGFECCPPNRFAAAGEKIFAALCDFTDELYRSRPLALSFELHEIPPDMAWRKNNLHELLKKEAAE